MAKTNASPAQNTVANNDVKTDLGITFKNVKTQSVNIGGTDFYYRKLGDKDAGHGGMYQYHEAFVKSALAFLAK